MRDFIFWYLLVGLLVTILVCARSKRPHVTLAEFVVHVLGYPFFIIWAVHGYFTGKFERDA